MGLVINGVVEEIPGLKILSWHDNPVFRLKPREDEIPRSASTWVHQIIAHTTGGIPGGHDLRPQRLIPGLAPPCNDGERVARMWSNDGKHAGAHFVVDRDGVIVCLADILLETTYHAPPCNSHSVGIEIAQGHGPDETPEDQRDQGRCLYEGQLDAFVLLVDALTRRLRIQRQFHFPYRKGPILRLEQEGKDCVGIFGHRDVSATRGFGDPGDFVFQRLLTAGYEPYDFGLSADKTAWKARQAKLGLAGDGVPGPATCEALVKSGMHNGLWVQRPSDEITVKTPLVS